MRTRYAIAGFSCALALCVALFAAVLVVGSASAHGGTGGGLFRTQWVQSVGLSGEWQMICQAPSNSSSCVQVTGLLPVPGSGIILMTYTTGRTIGGSGQPAGLGIGELNATTGAWTSRTLIGCEPYLPYYPGNGGIVYIPCSAPLSGANSSIVEYDYSRTSIVGDLATPTSVSALGNDPANGDLYAAFDNGSIESINPTTGAVLAQSHVFPPGSGPDFGGAWNDLSWTLMYDSYSNLLLTQTGGSAVEALNPTNLTMVDQIPTGSPPWAMAIDPVNRELYIGTSAGDVLAFDAVSFEPTANMSIPSGVCGTTAPFLADQMTFDPAHGDLYLAGFWYCLGVVNTTGNYALPSHSVGGDGNSRAAYIPDSGEILIYYPWFISVGPIVAGVLTHSQSPALTSVLGLSPLLGECALAFAVWTPIALVAFLAVRRSLRRDESGSRSVNDTGSLENRKP